MATGHQRHLTKQDPSVTTHKGEPVQVRIKTHVWNSLQLDDAERYNLALCSFFLGRNVEETRDLLNRPYNDAEVQYVHETAVLSGLNSNLDCIIQVP